MKETDVLGAHEEIQDYAFIHQNTKGYIQFMKGGVRRCFGGGFRDWEGLEGLKWFGL